MIKPSRILLLMLLINILLGIFVLLFPDGKIQITPEYSLRFVSLRQVLRPEQIKYADISKILEDEKITVNEIEKPADTLSLPLPETNPAMDSATALPDTLDVERFVNKAEAQKLAEITYNIEYPDNADTLLHPFFRQLDSLSIGNRHIRILHFGDSQIEGDRVTSTFRNRMQSKFGGCGSGLIPVYEPGVSRSTVLISQSGNWKKAAIYGNLHKGFKSKRYGIMGSVFRYFSPSDTNPEVPDTSLKMAWIDIKRSPQAYSHAKRFEKLNLFYSRTSGATKVNLLVDKTKFFQEKLESTYEPAQKTWVFDTVPSSLKLNFFSKISPDIFGIALDCNTGLAVDNIPMRGSSGTDFTRMDLSYFSAQVKKINAKLLILQYGVNVVPYVVSNYSYYEHSFYKQLKALKENNPGICILVIGVSDMSTKEGVNFVTYPNVEKIRNAQRNAAFRAGCAFWDVYEAMGGKNSMPSWVAAEPPLAEKDYTHFSFRGARIIGEMIYNALMKEYYEFKEIGDRS